MFDLGLRSRVLLATVWIGAQAALVLTGGRRPDAAFAFRMFPESSTIVISLSREVPRGLIPTPGGAWTAHDKEGMERQFAWGDRVKDPILSNLDVTVSASYGVNAQLSRLQAALDDVAAHAEGDNETIRLVADVVVRKNGHEPFTVRLSSATRPR